MVASLVLAFALGIQSGPPTAFGLPADVYIAGLHEFYPRDGLRPLATSGFGSAGEDQHALCIIFKATKDYPPVNPSVPGTYIGLQVAVPGSFTGSESTGGGYTAHISGVAYTNNQWFPISNGGGSPTYGMYCYPDETAPAGLFIPINPDEDEVEVPITVKRTITTVTDDPESEENIIDVVETFYSVTYTVYRHDALDAAMDTRRGFGDPSRDGGVVADPNSSLRNLNFGSWIFRGGLFIGNVAWPYQDRSGTARIQLWPQGTTSVDAGDRVYATSTLFDLGGPPTVSGGSGPSPYPSLDVPILGNFVPVDDDEYLSETETTATWDRRWTVFNREDLSPGNLPDGSYIDDNGDVIYMISMDVSPNNDCGPGGLYWNFPLTASYPDTSNSLWVYYFTEAYQRGIGIICQEESNRQIYSDDENEGNNETYGQTWRYFASREWESDRIGESASFPHSDSAPRVWVIEYTGDRTSGWVPDGWLFTGSQEGS